MTGILTKRGTLDTESDPHRGKGLWRHTQRRPCEDGDLQWHLYRPRNAKDCQQTIRSERKQGRILLQLSEGAWSCWHLSFDLLASKTVKKIHFRCFRSQEYMNAKLLQSCPTLCNPLWTVVNQAPLSMGFSRQEYWVSCHVLLQGIFPIQGSNLHLLWLLHCRQILYYRASREAPLGHIVYGILFRLP